MVWTIFSVMGWAGLRFGLWKCLNMYGVACCSKPSYCIQVWSNVEADLALFGLFCPYQYVQKAIDGGDPLFVRPPTPSDLATLAFGCDSLPSNLGSIGFNGTELPKFWKIQVLVTLLPQSICFKFELFWTLRCLNLNSRSGSLSDHRCKDQFCRIRI